MQLIFLYWFCILQLYWIWLLVLTVFWWSFFGLLFIKFCHLQHRDNFTSSFPTWMPFIIFSSLIFLARTSISMLNKSGESEHLCFVSDLGGKSFIYSPLSMMLVVGMSYMAFIMSRYISSKPSILICWVFFFLMKRYSILSSAFLNLLR